MTFVAQIERALRAPKNGATIEKHGTRRTTFVVAAAAALTSCTGTCTQPVHRLKAADLTPYMDSYRYKQLPVRGGAFLIAAENRAAFNDFWNRAGAYASLSATKYNWTSGASGIDLYELDPDSGGTRRLTSHWGIDVGGSWSPEPAGNNQILYGHYSSAGALTWPSAPAAQNSPAAGGASAPKPARPESP